MKEEISEFIGKTMTTVTTTKTMTGYYSNIRVARAKILSLVLMISVLLFCYHLIREEFTVEIDYDNALFVSNMSYLDPTTHVTPLVSSFQCSTLPLHLLILVSSDVPSKARRELIRRTWGKRLKQQVFNDYRLYFVIGIKNNDKMNEADIRKEVSSQKDLIFVNATRTNTRNEKSYKVEAMFEYAFKHCRYEYLLLTEDDVYVNLSHLIHLLDQPSIPRQNLYLGYVNSRQKVQRHGIEAITPREYKTKNYPPFCDGSTMVFSADLVRQFIPFFQRPPFRLVREYIGMLALNTGVQPLHDSNFKSRRSCTFDNTALSFPVSTKYIGNCMEILYFEMLKENLDDPFITMHYIDFFNGPRH